MTEDVHIPVLSDERVEAAATVLRGRFFPGSAESPEGAWLAHAREVLLAADAVVTEEDLERVLSGAFQGWTDQVDPFGDQARAILALFRGGGRR